MKQLIYIAIALITLASCSGAEEDTRQEEKETVTQQDIDKAKEVSNEASDAIDNVDAGIEQLKKELSDTAR